MIDKNIFVNRRKVKGIGTKKGAISLTREGREKSNNSSNRNKNSNVKNNILKCKILLHFIIFF